jgi:sugar-specific transcriptional regulator TrmB
MIQDDEYIHTLTDLGLTLLQAKTYLALAKLGKAEVRTISKASNVARQDIYRIMLTLEKLGLVEKIIDTPTLYKAIPLRKGLLTLLQRRTEENAELQKKTRALINNFRDNNTGIAFHEDESQFTITSELALFRKKLAEATDAARTSKDVIYTAEGVRALSLHYLQHVKRAMRRGVKIRVITEKPENAETTLGISPDLKKNPLFKLKYISDHSPVFMAIFDNKEVNIRISDNIVPSFWSNNPSVVKLAASYFEAVWKEAHEF